VIWIRERAADGDPVLASAQAVMHSPQPLQRSGLKAIVV
jgi:hypothetical protein